MQEPTLSVSELNAGIATALTRAFPDEVWVRGEIRDLNRAASGHVYFTLVDEVGSDDATPEASVPVTLFASDRRAVNRVLLRTGALRMTDGVAVRIRGRVSHYAARGTVQVRMTWIDTDYTVGRLAADREKLLRTLAAEDLLDANASLAIPLVPLRIGLVTSADSAAEHDFLSRLLASGYHWSVVAHDARVQGPDAPGALGHAISALDGQVDVIAIVRGGGAATDLAAFDDERLARTIAGAGTPVMTGIGHEVDSTIADRVAAVAHGTPTACASAIVSQVTAYLDRLGTLAAATRLVADHALARDRLRLAIATRRIGAATTASARLHRALTSRRTARVARGGQNAVRRAVAKQAGLDRRIRETAGATIERHRARLAVFDATIAASDPARLLAKGWSITRDATGSPLRSIKAIDVDSPLTTQVADGMISSRVSGVKAADQEGDG